MFRLHSEGSAIDWHLDARKPRDRRAAKKLIDRFLATDRDGNPHALARRMGSGDLELSLGGRQQGMPPSATTGAASAGAT